MYNLFVHKKVQFVNSPPVHRKAAVLRHLRHADPCTK